MLEWVMVWRYKTRAREHKDAQRIYWSFNVVVLESNELNCLQVANNHEAKTVLTLQFLHYYELHNLALNGFSNLQ